MTTVIYKGQTYYWNGFWGFFFLPVCYPQRKREKEIREGHPLYNILRSLAGYP